MDRAKRKVIHQYIYIYTHTVESIPGPRFAFLSQYLVQVFLLFLRSCRENEI